MILEKSRLNQIAVYGLLDLAVFLLQTTLLSDLRLMGVVPVMTVAAVVAVAMFEGELTGGLFGLFLGLAMDATVSAAAGRSALTLLLIGALCGLVSRLYMLPGFFSAFSLYCCSYAAILAGDLLLRLIVTADFSGFFAHAESIAMTAVTSFFYLPIFYLIARRIHLTFSGEQTQE
ncbi:MAG: hypothetical protein IJL39_06320 [Clostridia bacterium]|nr:hypothetical protein [Clostridia bacterium]